MKDTMMAVTLPGRLLALHLIVRVGGGWAIRRSGAARASAVFRTKREALSAAINLAGREAMTLYIHRRDGTVERKVNP